MKSVADVTKRSATAVAFSVRPSRSVVHFHMRMRAVLTRDGGDPYPTSSR
jgi:hypothetical protein